MNDTIGFAHFLTQTDAAGSCVLLVLIAMSIGCWTVIVLKSWQHWLNAAPARHFRARYAGTTSLPALERLCLKDTGDSAYRRLTLASLAACRQWRHRSNDPAFEGAGAEELVARALRQELDVEAARQENGLTLLATVGSAAPFVGLFGTVWGIYHALIAIGLSGQGSLDKVAGPVGEALIMTACGLAVAIPAVLAYNAFVRLQRKQQDALENFAHQLYGFLATGVALGSMTETQPAAEITPLVSAGRSA